MKLAFYAPWEIKDGIYTYTRFLREGLEKSGVKSKIIPHYEERMSVDYLKSVAEGINKKYDLVHLQHEFGYFGNWKNIFNPLLSTFLKSIKTKKVITVHGFHPWLVEMDPRRPYPPFRPLKKLIRNFLRETPWAKHTFSRVFNETDGVIVHTDFHREHLIKTGVRPEKIVVIPHGVEADQEKEDGEAWKKKKGLGGKRILTIFGFLDQSKGYDLALKALEELPKEVVLVIAGGTRIPEQIEYQKMLQAEIEEKNLKSRVVETGFLEEEEVKEVMAATDVLLVPQHYASTSGSLHLGLSFGKAIIASDLPYAEELNKRLECLKLIPRGSDLDLKRAVEELLEDDRRRKDLEEKAISYARTYSWEEIAKLHKELHARLVK